MSSYVRSPANEGTDRFERILSVAARLFAENGYHGTGMTELGEAVNLKRGALYYYIGSKERLLYEISARHVTDMLNFGDNLIKETLPAIAKIWYLSRQLIRTIHEDLNEVTVFMREIETLTGEYRKRIIMLRERFEDVWMRILEQGVSEGTFRHADPLLIKAILGMHNYSYIWLKPGGAMQPEEIAEYFCDLLFRGMFTDSGEAEYRALLSANARET